ncbi:diguanylate cyclase domain-containing protein [Roseibium sp.]|uniref:sensor domain-containing diguanylate cyclase n=1 Tax=Roseibium sp. TaxID=1936156 RepID=UPI003D12E951
MALDSKKDTVSGADLLKPSSIDFETLVKLSGEAIIVIGIDGTPAFISPATEQLLGCSIDDLKGRLNDLVNLDETNPDAELLHQILSGKGDPSRPLPHAELQLKSVPGRLVWADVTTHILRDGSRSPYGFAVYLRDISRSKELENQLDAATQTDSLTGLFNRRAFEDNLKREWAVALREKTHTSLIKVSLDRFDQLAEKFGKTAADECISKIAATLKETARRPADVTARTGTSEFSLLLPRTHEMGAETISAYIQVAIQDLGIPNPDNAAGNGIVTASVGAACTVAEQTGVSEGFDFILAAAENCVTEARRQGGNRVKTVMNVLGR